MPRQLRDYQQDAVQSIINAWGSDERRIAVVMATGLGKSTVIAATAVFAKNMGLRVVMLAHRGELLTQMADTVRDLDPTAEVGIVQAEQDDHHHDIVAASFQTIAKAHRRERLGQRDVILVDEVHHLPAATYVEAVHELGGNGDSFLCGFTATLSRTDGGLGDVIDKVVFERDIRWGIENGYLIAPHGLTVRIPGLDLSSVKTVAGDFQQSDLAEQMEAATEYVVDAIENHASGRQMIVFAAGVDAARMIATECNARTDMVADYIVGETPRETRALIFDQFRRGVTNVLVTVQVLTEGVDLPMCDAVVIARPTQSRVLFTQMVGRALRPHPGKSDALVLDLSGTTRTIKIARLVDLTPAHTRAVNLDGTDLDEDDPLLAEPPAPRMKRSGPVDLAPVELFDNDGNDILWLQTTNGTWFIPGYDHIVFAAPGRGDWFTVVSASTKGVRRSQGIGTFDTLADAVSAAEDHVIDRWSEVPRRSASWRRKGGAPSDKQLAVARSLNIPDMDAMTRARLSDEISIKFAERTMRWAASF